MKKILFTLIIIAVNIFLILVIDCLFFCYMDSKINHLRFQESFSRYKNLSRIIYFDEVYKEKLNTNYFRDYKTSTEKRPILIFGCSFGYGFLLSPEQSFSYKLSEYTKRSVYNRSVSSLGIQYFPYILEHYNLENEVKNPEYIIFVLIDNHLYRLYREIMGIDEPYVDILYKSDKNVLKERTLPYAFLFKSAIIRYLNVISVWNNYLHKSNDETFDFMKQHFFKAKNLAHEKFPDAKIVIFHYEDNSDSWLLNTKRWKELEDEGFIIINSYNITGVHLYEEQYKIKNDVHPNEKAWDLIVPKLTQRLKL